MADKQGGGDGRVWLHRDNIGKIQTNLRMKYQEKHEQKRDSQVLAKKPLTEVNHSMAGLSGKLSSSGGDMKRQTNLKRRSSAQEGPPPKRRPPVTGRPPAHPTDKPTAMTAAAQPRAKSASGSSAPRLTTKATASTVRGSDVSQVRERKPVVSRYKQQESQQNLKERLAEWRKKKEEMKSQQVAKEKSKPRPFMPTGGSAASKNVLYQARTSSLPSNQIKQTNVAPAVNLRRRTMVISKEQKSAVSKDTSILNRRKSAPAPASMQDTRKKIPVTSRYSMGSSLSKVQAAETKCQSKPAGTRVSAASKACTLLVKSITQVHKIVTAARFSPARRGARSSPRLKVLKSAKSEQNAVKDNVKSDSGAKMKAGRSVLSKSTASISKTVSSKDHRQITCGRVRVATPKSRLNTRCNSGTKRSMPNKRQSVGGPQKRFRAVKSRIDSKWSTEASSKPATKTNRPGNSNKVGKQIAAVKPRSRPSVLTTRTNLPPKMSQSPVKKDKSKPRKSILKMPLDESRLLTTPNNFTDLQKTVPRSVRFSIPGRRASLQQDVCTPTKTPSAWKQKELSMRQRLNAWLKAKGKTPSRYSHLMCFGQELSAKRKEVVPSPQPGLTSRQLENQQEQLDLEDVKKDLDMEMSDTDDEDLQISQSEHDPLMAQVLGQLQECSILFEAGCPVDKIVSWLDDLQTSCPQAVHCAEFWIFKAKVIESQSNNSAVLDVFEQALKHKAKPANQLATAVEMFVRRRMDVSRNSTDKPTSDIDAYVTDREQGVVMVTRLQEPLPTEAPVTPKETVDEMNMFQSSAVKYCVTQTTPFMKKMQSRTPSSLQRSVPKAVVTPVRRSTRRSIADLPSMLQDHDVIIADLEDIPKSAAQETLYIPNIALE